MIVCGVVGMFGELPTNERTFRLFNQMMVMNMMRGIHSAGVAAIHGPKTYQIVKEVGTVNFLLWSKRYHDKVVNGPKPVALLGHCRHATEGEITMENAHPFRHGHIILAHNGTLVKHSWPKLVPGQAFGTDSETICRLIADEGVDEAYAKLDGAAALTWWDTEEQSLNLVTNGKRPLQIATSDDEKFVVYASEKAYITSIFAEEGFNLLEPGAWEPKPHWLCTFKMQEGSVHADYRELRPFVFRSSVVYPIANVGNFGANWDRVYGNKGVNNVTPLLPAPATERSFPHAVPDQSKVWKQVNRSKIIGGVAIKIEEFALKYDHCCFCNGDIDPPRDFPGGALINDTQVICRSCVETAEKEELAWVL